MVVRVESFMSTALNHDWSQTEDMKIISRMETIQVQPFITTTRSFYEIRVFSSLIK